MRSTCFAQRRPDFAIYVPIANKNTAGTANGVTPRRAIPTVGVLAYGSLITDPGEEIQNATVEIKKGIVTPFKVEFARTSRTRGGAPTLVPVDIGGAQVRGWIFVLDVPEEEAANRLWRRETDRVGSGMR